MIKDKHPIPPIVSTDLNKEIVTPEPISENPFVNMFTAVKRAILTIREEEGNALSPPLFQTIQIDNGQFERIIRDYNMEYEVAFPAVFIHFTNVRYLVQQQRLGEGRATMRVRFILNTLNNRDLEKECEPFLFFQRINVAIQDAKNHEPALNERCNLLFFDMPTTSNMLQAYWVDYEVYFRESTAWKYRNWIERYLVMPPFTDHSDAPQHDKDSHGKHDTPTFNNVSGFVPSVETDDTDKPEHGEEGENQLSH